MAASKHIGTIRMIATGSDQSMRRALSPLSQLADTHRCAILMDRHINKTGGVHALYRGGGSIGLVGACRSAWLVAPDPAQINPQTLEDLRPEATRTMTLDVWTRSVNQIRTLGAGERWNKLQAKGDAPAHPELAPASFSAKPW